MTIEERLMTIRKGAYVKATWQSFPAMSAKGKGHNVRKVSQGLVRVGVDYSNIKENEGKENNGLPETEKWLAFPYLIQNVVTGKKKVRLTVSKSATAKTEVKYYLDGNEITKEKLRETGFVRPSALDHKTTDLLVFNVLLENLLDIG